MGYVGQFKTYLETDDPGGRSMGWYIDRETGGESGDVKHGEQENSGRQREHRIYSLV